MKNIIKINLAVVLVYLMAYLLFKVNFPYLIYIIGLVFFFLPGLNIALVLEQITGIRQGLAKLSLWTWLYAIFFNSAIIYVLSLMTGKIAYENNVFSWFLLLWLISLVIFVFFYLWRGIEPSILYLPKYKDEKYFYWGMVTFLLVLGVNFVLYRFIPEADPYIYLVRVREVVSSHQMPQSELRPLFLVLTWAFSFVTKIPAYWLYKLIIPILAFPLIIVFYKYSLLLTKKKCIINYYSSVIFLTFPVIVMEILTPRPQSIFLISLPIIIFLLLGLLSEKNYRYNFYWTVSLLFISIIGVKFHQFFLFQILFVLLSIVVFLWSLIKRRPSQSLSLTLGTIFLAYPWIRELGILDILNGFLIILKPFLLNSQFNWWFISNYKNVDGVMMGWPGLSWIFYYGYNLGIVFLILLLIIVINKVKINLDFKNNWLYLICFVFFFIIAEVLPRFGLAYLPDRAWLFMSLILSFWAINYLTNLHYKNILLKKGQIMLFVLIIVSFILSGLVTYLKQGWITVDEFNAAKFVKKNIPKSAIFITQAGNDPLFSIFAERSTMIPNQRFFKDKDFLDNYLLNIPAGMNMKRIKEKQLHEIGELIQSNASAINTSNIVEKSAVINMNLQLYKLLLNEIENIPSDNYNPPIYIFYSKDKFNSLYGQREWWKDYNSYDSNLNIFRNNNFSLIYDRNGILIWRYNDDK